MNNYEYIIASLPVLSSDFRGELNCKEILDEIAQQLDKKDLSGFKTLVDGFNPDCLNTDFYKKALKDKNNFIRNYFLYDLCVRNCKVRFLNKNLGRDLQTDTIDITGDDFEFEDTLKVEEILSIDDILRRERGLDDLMWDKIDSLCGLQVFSIDVIYAFIAKLQIVDRWLKLDPERGRELFKELVNEIRNNKKSID